MTRVGYFGQVHDYIALNNIYDYLGFEPAILASSELYR